MRLSERNSRKYRRTAGTSGLTGEPILINNKPFVASVILVHSLAKKRAIIREPFGMPMLKITNTVFIPLSDIELTPIRAQGAGGQHVNKVSTAIHLRFNLLQSTLPTDYKIKLLELNDYRITADGMIIIKAQQYRSQEQNKADALLRLEELIKKVTVTSKKRKKTKPSRGSVKKRLDSKKQRGDLKKLRGTPS